MSGAEQERKLRVQRMVADKVTDEMLTKPTGQLTVVEAAILRAALLGVYADEIIARIDKLRAPVSVLGADTPHEGESE